MNITTISLCSTERDDSTKVHLSFDLNAQYRTNPYVLKAATGLDTDEIIKTYNDGPQFFRVRPAQRTVSFSLKLNPNYQTNVTAGNLRDSLYKMISYNTKGVTWNSDSKIEIRFFSETTYIASLFGFVTRVEANSFLPDTEAMVEIQCEFPFLRCNFNQDMHIENTIWPPRSYDKLINDWHHVEIHAMTFLNDTRSTAPHGFQMYLEVKPGWPNINQLVIFDERNPDKYLFWVVWDFFPGEIVRFSSNDDNKYIFLANPDGSFKRSLMDRILWGSVWPFMLPGYNQFDISYGFKVTAASHAACYWGL